MFRPEIRRFLITASLVAGVPFAWPADTTPIRAEQGWSAVTRCAQAESGSARHACLDRVLRDAGLLTEEMGLQQQRRAFGLEDRPAVAAPPVAAASAAAPSSAPTTPPVQMPKPLDTPTTSASPDRLEIQIASVQKAPDGKLLVTTTEGAVWRQTEAVEMPLPPRAGERMTLRRGSLGGYRCSVVSTHLTFRCERNR